MADRKVKIAIFGTAIVVAVVVIIGLCVHRSFYRDRLCKDTRDLFYQHPNSNTSECLRAGLQERCGKNMVLVPDRRNSSKGIGICACDWVNNDRPLVYHEETNQCYFIFTQAYCEEGQWLSGRRSNNSKLGHFECDTKVCEDSPDTTVEMVPLADGRCVALNRQDGCNASEVVRFYKTKMFPSCKKPLGQTIGSVGVPSTDCPSGSHPTETGICQPEFEFD